MPFPFQYSSLVVILVSKLTNRKSGKKQFNSLKVLELNKEAFSKLSTEKKLTVVPGATHLFEEPGKLEEVAKLAISWFSKYLS
jgi:hypothetical protein